MRRGRDAGSLQLYGEGVPGTGHWYTCENGYPFTVGECGMPMKVARCPECCTRVGGIDHISMNGVRREDIEQLARDVRMGICFRSGGND
jgi:hypothetical protein